jgi:hypothetical protein
MLGLSFNHGMSQYLFLLLEGNIVEAFLLGSYAGHYEDTCHPDMCSLMFLWYAGKNLPDNDTSSQKSVSDLQSCI